MYEKNCNFDNISNIPNDEMMMLLLNENFLVNDYFFDIYKIKPTYFQIMSIVGNNMKKFMLLAKFYPEHYDVIVSDFFKIIDETKINNTIVTKNELNEQNNSNNTINVNIPTQLEEKPKKSTRSKKILKVTKQNQPTKTLDNLLDLVDF